jgi:hypothetical protein
MKDFHLGLMLLLFASCGVAHAEGGCPPGQYPQNGNGFQNCVPIPGSSQPAPEPQKLYWVSRWQSIAIDTDKAIIGSAINQKTSSSAEMAALDDCRKQGGASCQTAVTHSNGCAAIVASQTLVSNGAGDTKVDAEREAFKNCGSSDKTCRLLYSACSPAVLQK